MSEGKQTCAGLSCARHARLGASLVVGTKTLVTRFTRVPSETSASENELDLPLNAFFRIPPSS
jgi:hypothetical protein